MTHPLIKKTILLTASALSVGFLVSCSHTGVLSDSTQKTEQNDFPTLARVEYVMQCMQRHGGQSYTTLYSCACTLDKLANQIPYETFTQAQTFENMKRTPGEKGAIFRDSPQAKPLREQLKKAQKIAESSCFVK